MQSGYLSKAEKFKLSLQRNNFDKISKQISYYSAITSVENEKNNNNLLTKRQNFRLHTILQTKV